MEHIGFFTLLWLFLGLITNALIRLVKLKGEKSKFSLGFWIKDNYLSIFLSIIGGFFGLYFADELVEVMELKASPDAAFYEFHAFVCGLLGHHLISKIESLYKK